jgi:hypothetical protein
MLKKNSKMSKASLKKATHISKNYMKIGTTSSKGLKKKRIQKVNKMNPKNTAEAKGFFADLRDKLGL